MTGDGYSTFHASDWDVDSDGTEPDPCPICGGDHDRITREDCPEYDCCSCGAPWIQNSALYLSSHLECTNGHMPRKDGE